MSTTTLTKPQQFVLAQMRAGATLRSRPGAGISPWLEMPATTKVAHVSFLTMAGLFDRKLIVPVPRDVPGSVTTWTLTPAGQEIDL